MQIYNNNSPGFDSVIEPSLIADFKASNGGGSSATLIEKTVTENGTYNASEDNADGYSKITVDIHNTYTNEDEGKVVSGGELVAQTAYPTEIIENDTYDTTNYNSITVNVSGGSSSVVAICTFDFSESQFLLEDESWTIGESAFSDCSALISITILSGVTSIGDNAFVGCQALTSITIPNSVTSIGDNAFGSCTGLETVTFESNSSLESIEDSAFMSCSSLVSIAIPSSVTSIGNYVFSSCTSLTSITIPSGVTSIGDEAFCDCESLGTVIFSSPSSIESIGYRAFSGQYEGTPNLTTITIPSSVTSIGDDAFSSNLEILTFEPTTPPELEGDLGISTTCIIRVPQGTLSDYTSASNYPDPSEYTYEEY